MTRTDQGPQREGRFDRNRPEQHVPRAAFGTRILVLATGLALLSAPARAALPTFEPPHNPGQEIQADRPCQVGGISEDGRYVLFASDTAALLPPGARPGIAHLYLRDLVRGTTELVDVAPDGSPSPEGVGNIARIRLSGNGRFALFDAAGLVPGVPGPALFLRDLRRHTTERADVGSDGTPAENSGVPVGVSTGGRYVVFQAHAPNLDPQGGDPVIRRIFVRDRWTRTTRLVARIPRDSVAPGWTATTDPEARFLGYDLRDPDLSETDPQRHWVTFHQDLRSGKVTRVAVAMDGGRADADTYVTASANAISRGGRYVAFESPAGNLVPGDKNGMFDIFRRDMLTGRTRIVSVAPASVPGNGQSLDLAISADGGSAAFSSNATDLVPGDTNAVQDVFLRDMARGTTRLVSVTADGAPGNGSSGDPRYSGSGRFVAFSSNATDLVPGDTNAVQDVFVRDLRSNRTVRASVG